MVTRNFSAPKGVDKLTGRARGPVCPFPGLIELGRFS